MDVDARIGRRLRLRDLHILLAVAQSGSMAKAAVQLAMSQPAGVKVICPSLVTLIRPSRFRRRIAIVTAGALTFSQRTRVAAITTSPSLSASAMVLM